MRFLSCTNIVHVPILITFWMYKLVQITLKCNDIHKTKHIFLSWNAFMLKSRNFSRKRKGGGSWGRGVFRCLLLVILSILWDWIFQKELGGGGGSEPYCRKTPQKAPYTCCPWAILICWIFDLFYFTHTSNMTVQGVHKGTYVR